MANYAALLIFEVFEDSFNLKKSIKSAGFLFISFSDKAVLCFLWNVTLSNFFFMNNLPWKTDFNRLKSMHNIYGIIDPDFIQNVVYFLTV
jgi:hypothetical protein